MSFHVPSYPSIYAVGHKAVRDIFDDEVLIEEKLDGSFSAFCKIGGEFYFRSKGQQLVIDAPEKMFSKAVENTKQLDLHDGWVYYGEVFNSPKHNTLKYNRTPAQNIIIFDIERNIQDFLTYEEKAAECQRLGLEVVPRLFQGKINSVDELFALLDKESILGGAKIEGVVCKSFTQYASDKKLLRAKYVSEAFKEVHQKEWRTENPTQTDILQQLIAEYKTEARFNKAIQHLNELGQLTNTPKDIGALIKEIQSDILKEEEQEIKEKLFKYFWPKLNRAVTSGLPEFYKKKLAESNFTPTQNV